MQPYLKIDGHMSQHIPCLLKPAWFWLILGHYLIKLFPFDQPPVHLKLRVHSHKCPCRASGWELSPPARSIIPTTASAGSSNVATAAFASRCSHSGAPTQALPRSPCYYSLPEASLSCALGPCAARLGAALNKVCSPETVQMDLHQQGQQEDAFK